MPLLKNIEDKISEFIINENLISEVRKELLKSFAEYISDKAVENKTINLIFICTHNSRRSTMAQKWVQTAAEYFEIPNIQCYSGGTEATAFNPNAVKAVEESGFIVAKMDESDNPMYLVTYSEENGPIKCFSKIYSDSLNPQKDFAAIMTCSVADANCPMVLGAEVRFPVKYDDPKEFDGTEIESQKYKERFEQIGVEMIYTFNKMKSEKK